MSRIISGEAVKIMEELRTVRVRSETGAGSLKIIVMRYGLPPSQLATV